MTMALLRKVDRVRYKELGRQEVFSDGTDPPAQADTREEVGKKAMLWLVGHSPTDLF